MGTPVAPHLTVLASPRPQRDQAASRRELAVFQQQLLEDFLRSRRITASASAVHSAVSALRANFLPWLEMYDLHVWDVRPDDLDAWATSLKNSVRTRTHQHYFGQVALFYEWLTSRRSDELHRRFGITVVNPVDRFNRARRLHEDERLVPVPRDEVVAYSLAASRAQIAAAASDAQWLKACRNFTLWMVLRWAGLRRQEACDLACGDVDLVGGLLRVLAGKGGKGRIVHIQPPLAPTLRWYLQEVRPQTPGARRTEALFLNGRGGPLDADSVANLLRHHLEVAGLPAEDRFTCHGLRRAYATHLYKALRQQGFRDPLVYVKGQLGHAYLSTTQRYCQLDDDYTFFLTQEATTALTEYYGGDVHDHQVDPAPVHGPAGDLHHGRVGTANGRERLLPDAAGAAPLGGRQAR